MRIKTYALGVTASIGVTVAWFAGCGGTVAETASGTGSGGHTTTTTATATTTSITATTTSVTETTTTSMTMTGTTPCDMACAHIQMCTGFTCAMANIDCSTLGSGFDCVAECASNTPCADLGLGTLTMCQNQCKDGGAGDGGATDGGPAIGACSQCELTNCAQAGAGCATDATCQGWLACANTCNGASPQVPSCYAACDAMYASASAKFAPIYACSCTSCATECAGGNPCAYGTDGGP